MNLTFTRRVKIVALLYLTVPSDANECMGGGGGGGAHGHGSRVLWCSSRAMLLTRSAN